MGYFKAHKVSDTEVVFTHQLDYRTGEVYNDEQVTVKGSYLRNIEDGAVGTISWSFMPTTGDTSGLKFMEPR